MVNSNQGGKRIPFKFQSLKNHPRGWFLQTSERMYQVRTRTTLMRPEVTGTRSVSYTAARYGSLLQQPRRRRLKNRGLWSSRTSEELQEFRRRSAQTKVHKSLCQTALFFFLNKQRLIPTLQWSYSHFNSIHIEKFWVERGGKTLFLIIFFFWRL